MSSKQRWRIYVKNLQTSIRIGIYDEEKKGPQKIIVNAVIESEYAARPLSVEECSNYELVYREVMHEWPKRAHIDLLETCITQLLTHIFSNDANVQYAKVCISKPERFPGVESVGIEAEWTRRIIRHPYKRTDHEGSTGFPLSREWYRLFRPHRHTDLLAFHARRRFDLAVVLERFLHFF